MTIALQMQTKGVQSIAGDGLVKLAKWKATKHSQYRTFLARMHKFIAGMTIIEKEAREKAAKVEKALIGYDPDKWIKSEGAIRKEDQAALKYEKLNRPPPVKGRHKYTHCQRLCEQIHEFLAERMWTLAHPEGTAGGMTWTEMFVLFDTAAYRSEEAQHVKNEEALKRAIQRRDKAKAAKAKSN